MTKSRRADYFWSLCVWVRATTPAIPGVRVKKSLLIFRSQVDPCRFQFTKSNLHPLNRDHHLLMRLQTGEILYNKGKGVINVFTIFSIQSQWKRLSC